MNKEKISDCSIVVYIFFALNTDIFSTIDSHDLLVTNEYQESIFLIIFFIY